MEAVFAEYGLKAGAYRSEGDGYRERGSGLLD